ncbi:MAG: MMPL family transporter [Phycisphaerae bacterium]
MVNRPGQSGRQRWTERTADCVVARGRSLLIAGVVVVSLCLVSATGLQWNENIADLLPRDDPVVSMFFRFADRFDAMDYLYFEVGPSGDGREPTEEQLIASADQLHRQLASSGLFDRIMYRWQMQDLHVALQTITEHRASLFTEDDEARLTQELDFETIHKTLQDWRRALTESPAPFMSQSFYEDPLDINGIFLDKLRALQALGGPLTVREGRLFSQDGKHILLIALPQFPSTDSYRAEKLIALVDDAVRTIEAADASGRTRISYFGGHRASLENAQQIKGDIKFTIALSIVAIAVLSFLVYSRPLLVLLTFLPVFIGATFASGVIRWLDPFISAISIGCGSMLIGIAVDYAIHILYSADQTPSNASSREAMADTLRRLLLPIGLSASTTLAAFCALHFSIMPGYRNLGHFGALGIVGAAVSSIVILPVIAGRFLRRTSRRPVLRLTDLFSACLAPRTSARAKARGSLVVLAALTLISLAGLPKLQFEGDIQKLNSVTPETRRDWDRVVSVFGDVMSSTAFAVQGRNLEEALRQNEMLATLLEDARRRGDVKSVSTIAGLLPSGETQARNRQRWTNFWNDDRLAKLRRDLERACAEQRMRPEAFEEFLRSLPGPMPAIAFEDYQQGMLGDLLSNHLSTGEEDVFLLTSVRLGEADEFGAILDQCRERVPGILAFNGRFLVRHMVELIYNEMKRLGVLALAFILLILLVFVRRVGLLAAMLVPLLASLLWTFGLMGWVGIRLNLMNSAVVVFIFGLVVDYSIFMTMAMRARAGEDSDHVQRTCGAIVISASTTLCGMGALLFARHPALHTIGATAFLGIGSGLVAVLVIVPLFETQCED